MFNSPPLPPSARPCGEQTGHVVVVFVHGYGEHAARYAHVAAALGDAGVRSILWDLPGHGRHSPLDGELPKLAELHELIATTVAHGSAGLPVVLFGHSLGGLIAASYARRFPETLAGLVLSSPVLGQWTAIDAFRDLPEIPPSLVRPHHLSKREGFADEYAADNKIYRGPLRRSALELGEAALTLLAETDPTAVNPVPTLWLHGSVDKIAPVRHAQEGVLGLHLTDLAVRVFPHGKHELFHDAEREEALAELSRFVQRVAHSSPQSHKNGVHT